MPELRYDPLMKRWVIIATERAARPSDLTSTAKYGHIQKCPFCEGNESFTPPEIMAVRDPHTQPNSPGWKVRVVPNKYPALKTDATSKRMKDGLHERIDGKGAHEVIIESPKHNVDLTDLSNEEIKWVLSVYRQRIRALYKDSHLKYALLFKNHKKAAGASLGHLHSQIIATPIIPQNVKIKLTASQEYFKQNKNCLICDLIQQEIQNKKRIITKNNGFIAIAPYASHFPFEIFIAPLKHSHNFVDISDKDLERFSPFLKDILLRIKLLLEDPPFNFVLHTSPNPDSKLKAPDKWESLPSAYHWHIDIIPRLIRIAGFEWGSGFYINPSTPETAARYLRNINLS